MTVHPRLVRSIPFWILIAGSVAAIGGGAYILVDKLGNMQTTILDNTATGVDVYVGQIWGVFGGILVGAGIVGLALALAVAALRSLVPASPGGVAEKDAPSAADEATPVVPAETTATPVVDSPVVDPSTTSTLESSANDTPADAPQR